MTERQIDLCIIGQGLAGTALAWMMLQRGKRVLLIDPGLPVTSSRVAAGLLTPLTGPKLSKTIYWDQARPVAEQFYRSLERQFRIPLFDVRDAVHLFRSQDEQLLFSQRSTAPEFQQQARLLPRAELPPGVVAPWGGFAMPEAAQLHVNTYLDFSRDYFLKAGCLLAETLDPQNDLCMADAEIRIPRWHLRTQQLVFCQGWTPAGNSWFDKVFFQPAKGEILSLEIPGRRERRSLHAGCWLAPNPRFPESYSLGATFEWQQLDQTPTPAASERLLGQLQQWYPEPVRVIGQQAAVRPTMKDFHPVIGTHPTFPRLGIFNGLGTRGSLLAPWLAGLLANHLDYHFDLPLEMDVKRWFR